jgi:hypothetical protein
MPDEATVDSVLEELTDEQVLEQIGMEEPGEPVVESEGLEADLQIDLELDDDREEPAEPTDLWADRAYRVVDSNGKPYERLEDMSVEQMLGGEARIEYTVSGETKNLALNKLVDWATRLPGTSKAGQEARDRVKELDAELEKYSDLESKNSQNEALLRRILRGDDATLAKAREAYEKGMGEDFLPPKAEPATDDTTDAQAAEEAAGRRLAIEVIGPHAEALAEAFGAEPGGIAIEIAQMIKDEGRHLTWATVNDILNRRVIERLEENGYEAERWERFDTDKIEASTQGATQTSGIKPKGATPEVTSDDSLKAENEKLRAQLAEARVSGAGDVERDAGASNDRKGRKPNKKYKSELIDLTEADSVDDILKQLDDMEERYG